MHHPRYTTLTRIFVLLFAGLALGAFAPAAANADQLRGAMVHALWSSESTDDALREIDTLADTGATSARIDVAWSSLETDGKGQYSDWFIKRTDAVFQRAHDRGIKVVAMLWSTPCWASSAPSSLKGDCSGDWWNKGVDRYAPTNMADFGDAAQFVANRWGSDLAAIEIWNEPNLQGGDFLTSDDPAATDVALLKAAYPSIKAVAPQLPVLAGALAGSDGDFLNKLYDDGIAGNFDGIAIHPYNESRDPTDKWQEQFKQWSFLRGVPWIHQIMADHGDGDKGIWLTEFGFSTCGNGDTWCVSAAQQAKYISESFALAAKWPYVKAAIVYNLRNKGTDATDREDQFGLLNSDFTPKPAFASFKQSMSDAAAGTGDYSASAIATTDIADFPSSSGTTSLGLTQPPQVAAPSATVTAAGVAPVPLSCASTATKCTGKVTIETKKKIASGHGRAATIKLGARNVAIKRGGHKVVRISIPKRYRSLLRSLKTVKVVVTVKTTATVGAASSRQSGITLHTAKLAH